MKYLTKKTLLSVCTAFVLLCSLFLGMQLMRSQPIETGKAETATTTVTVSTNKAQISRGETMKVTVTVETTRKNYAYGAFSLVITPLTADGKMADSQAAKYFTMNEYSWTVSPYPQDYFMESVADFFKLEEDPLMQGCSFSLANMIEDYAFADVPFVFAFEVTLDDNAPDLGTLTWGVVGDYLGSVTYIPVQNGDYNAEGVISDHADNTTQDYNCSDIKQDELSFCSVPSFVTIR